MPFLAVAAIAAGAAVATGAVAASTIGLIGLGVSVVGKVTKSKELMQIGAGMGLGAGAASLASGLFGAAEGASAVDAAARAAAGTSDAAFDSWAATQGAAESTAGLDAFGGSTPSWAGQSSATTTEGLGNSVLSASKGMGQPGGGMTGMGATQGDVGSQTLKFAEKAGAITPPPATDPGSMKSWWQGLSEARKNTILQMGTQAVGGLFDGWTAEQKLAFERERFNLEQQKYNTGVLNANAQPTIIRPPASGGLLNAYRG